jgi:hypothetical protein
VTLHDFFLYSAVGGGVLFVVQLVLSALGAGDADIDFGAGDHPPTGHTSADTAFKVLSLQGLTAFFGMFGLVGLAMIHESKAGPLPAVSAALLGGALTTWIIARIFRAARSLEGSGTVDLKKTVGASGTVYLRVAPGKPGKVTLNVAGRLLQLDAVTLDETLDTGTEVRVTRLLADGSVNITRA